jgi:hypothetical protein
MVRAEKSLGAIRWGRTESDVVIMRKAFSTHSIHNVQKYNEHYPMLAYLIKR